MDSMEYFLLKRMMHIPKGLGKFNASYRREPFYTFGNKLGILGMGNRLVKEKDYLFLIRF